MAIILINLDHPEMCSECHTEEAEYTCDICGKLLCTECVVMPADPDDPIEFCQEHCGD